MIDNIDDILKRNRLDMQINYDFRGSMVCWTVLITCSPCRGEDEVVLHDQYVDYDDMKAGIIEALTLEDNSR